MPQMIKLLLLYDNCLYYLIERRARAMYHELIMITYHLLQIHFFYQGYYLVCCLFRFTPFLSVTIVSLRLALKMLLLQIYN